MTTMTWGQFKKVVEELGVKDYECIEYIDVGEPTKKEDINVHKDEIKNNVTMVSIYGGT